jgi:excisionase family DNA binding protein
MPVDIVHGYMSDEQLTINSQKEQKAAAARKRAEERKRREAKRKIELEKSPQAGLDRYGAAKYINASARTIAYLMADGSLPYLKLGPRMTRFLVKDLDEFLQRRRIGGWK